MKKYEGERERSSAPPWYDPFGSDLTAASETLHTPVSAIMIRDIVTAGFDMSLETLIPRLLEKNLPCAPVVEDGKLMGFVTVADMFDEEQGYRVVEPARKTVSEVMTQPPRGVTPWTSIAKAAASMAVQSAWHLPVVEEDKTVVGLVSAVDVLRWLLRSMGIGPAPGVNF